MSNLPTPIQTAPARTTAIIRELDRAAADYTEALAERDAANVKFEAARDRFASVRRIAGEILGGPAWWTWQYQHRAVFYAAMMIGGAIRAVLRTQAIESAVEVNNNQAREYSPAMTMEEIYETLATGGFEFTSATPRREVNAALMKLDGVIKNENGKYESSEAADILMMNLDTEKEKAETSSD